MIDSSKGNMAQNNNQQQSQRSNASNQFDGSNFGDPNQFYTSTSYRQNFSSQNDQQSSQYFNAPTYMTETAPCQSQREDQYGHQPAFESSIDESENTVTSNSPSISLSEPTKSPSALSPFLIPSSSSSTGVERRGRIGIDNNQRGRIIENENISDSQLQSYLQQQQQPLTISSVEIAAFHAREMSRSASGSMQSQGQISFQPEQNVARIYPPLQQDWNRNTFQLPTQRLQSNQRIDSSFTTPSIVGMPFTFANQTYDLTTPSLHSSQVTQNTFARPQQYAIGAGSSSGGLPNYIRTSSNPITYTTNNANASSSSSNSNTYKSITHRRVPAACNFCRMRKLRCDGNTPCRQCARRMIECVYSEAAETRRQRRATVSTFPHSTTSIPSAIQFQSNQTINRQPQELYSSLPNQRQNYLMSNDQLATGIRQAASLESQQMQVAEQEQHHHRFSRPQFSSNIEVITQQQQQYSNPQMTNNTDNTQRIAGLPVNWMPVSLHAPHRILPSQGGGNTSINTHQESSQSSSIQQQKSSPYSMSTMNNDWSISSSSDQRNRYKDPNQQSQQSYQYRKD